MFLSSRRVTAGWIASVLVSFTLLFVIPAHAAQAHRKCCVWRVTNAKAPFYMVGSIHALSKNDYHLPVAYEIAQKDSKRILLEFDPTRHVAFGSNSADRRKIPQGT